MINSTEENLYRNSAWLYDVDNRDNLHDDIPFYIEYAKHQKGEILELGCGTGRVALALADEGFHVTALDLSQQMLDVFHEKLSTKPEYTDRITLIHGNMTSFLFDRKYSMIIVPFRAFQSLTDELDIEKSLTSIYKHLSDDGIFIVNVFNPYPVMDESWCYEETVQWERQDEKNGNYVVKKHWGDKIDSLNRIIYPHFAFEVTYPDGRTERIVDDLKLKYYYNDQLRTVVEKAGFEITEEYSWYDKTPPGGREIIFICGKKPLSYRMATFDDLELLTQTRVEFFADIHKDMTDSQRADIYAYNKAYFKETLQDGTFAAYLAFDGELLVATRGINFYKTPPNPKNNTGQSAYISNMFTKPEYRDRGIASRLFDMTVVEARKRSCGKVVLHATDMGRPIYEKYGFIIPNGAMEYYFDK